MRLLLILSILVSFSSCKAQKGPNVLKFHEVGWILSVPSDSKVFNQAQIDSINEVTNQKLKSTYKQQFDYSNIQTLFAFTNDKYNFFSSTINPYDSSEFKTWDESYMASKGLMLQMLDSQKPDMVILDTLSSIILIDHHRFNLYYLKTFYPSKKVTMHTYWYCRLQNGYDFSINISFTDEKVGEQFLSITKTSKFDD